MHETLTQGHGRGELLVGVGRVRQRQVLGVAATNVEAEVAGLRYGPSQGLCEALLFGDEGRPASVPSVKGANMPLVYQRPSSIGASRDSSPVRR